MRQFATGEIVLSIGFSPCPNDTYIFDALVNGKIDTGNLRFEPLLEDVEQLNRLALEGELDITKLSFRAYAECSNSYVLCDAGSALGFGVGPLVVTGEQSLKTLTKEHKVAIPGNHTTANFLFRMFYPQVTTFRELLFSDIEDAVVNGTVDAGVIIHENRFTYTQKGLFKVVDLGALWESETSQPIPLGGIAAKRQLSSDLLRKVNQLIYDSLVFANAHPAGTDAYVAMHAQAMDDHVRKQHIALYVNDYSLDFGDGGRKAVRFFYDKAISAGVITNKLATPLFVSELED